jgi:hypothetical protein
VADDPNQPHPYVRRRDTVLGEWCVDCGRGSWHPLHDQLPPARRRHDPGALIEEPDLYEQGDERG